MIQELEEKKAIVDENAIKVLACDVTSQLSLFHKQWLYWGARIDRYHQREDGSRDKEKGGSGSAHIQLTSSPHRPFKLLMSYWSFGYCWWTSRKVEFSVSILFWTWGANEQLAMQPFNLKPCSKFFMGVTWCHPFCATKASAAADQIEKDSVIIEKEKASWILVWFPEKKT